MRSSFLILALNEDKLCDLDKEEEGKAFHRLPVLGMIDGCGISSWIRWCKLEMVRVSRAFFVLKFLRESKMNYLIY